MIIPIKSIKLSIHYAVQCGIDINCNCLHWPPVPELTIDGDGPRGSLGTDRVAGSAGVLSGIAPSGRVDDQGAAGDGDPGVGDDGRTIFAPLDCDLRPSRPRAAQRHISPLGGDGGSREADPGYCICRESRRKCFRIREAVWQLRGFPSARKLTGRTCEGGGSWADGWYSCRPIRFDAVQCPRHVEVVWLCTTMN